MNKCKNSFIAFKDGKWFIGNAEECARYTKSRAPNIYRAVDGCFVNGYMVKQITKIVIVYCIDKDNKHYEADNPNELKKVVWYSAESIRRYCVQNFVLKDGTKFYCRKEERDYETPRERKYIE